MALVPPTNLLAAQSVSASFDQLLYVDDDSGLEEATLRTVSTESTKSALQLCGEKVLVKSAETDQTAAFDVQNAAGTSILTINGSTVGATLIGTLTVGSAGSGHDVTFYSGTSGDQMVWDSSEEVLNITGTDGQTALDVLDGDLRVVDKIYLYDRGGEYISSNGSTLSIVGGAIDLDCTGAMQINSSGGAISIGNDAVAQAISIGTGSAARTITIGNTTGATGIVLNSGTGQVVINEDGGDACDLRVESDDCTTMLFVDASANRVGINPDATSGLGTVLLICGCNAASFATGTPAQDGIRYHSGNAASALCIGVDGNGMAWLQGYDRTAVAPRNILLQPYTHVDARVGIGTSAPAAIFHAVSGDTSDGGVAIIESTEGTVEGGDVLFQLDFSADADVDGAEAKFISFHDADGEIGYIAAASASAMQTAITNSDIRLKTDIKDSSLEGLNIINALKIRDFKWNDKAKKNAIGVQEINQWVADEVYEVYPKAVMGKPGRMKSATDEDGNKTGEEEMYPIGLAITEFIAPMMKAIQELSAEVEKLKNEGEA